MPERFDIQIVKQAASLSRQGLALFAIVRNENYFLPFFFSHYRAIGVETFLIYDDYSDDGTLDYLNAQPDCTIVRSNKKFADPFGFLGGSNIERRFVHVLKERLPEEIFPKQWVLTADADEFLVLPSGFADLQSLIRCLDNNNRLYAAASMVDFYGENLDRRNYDRSLNPFAGNPYFDAGPYYQWTGSLSPTQLLAGIRSRLLKMLVEKHPDQIRSIYGRYDVGPAKSWKIPLLKQGYGIFRIGDHEISAPPSGDLTVALAHFKFYPDLDSKITLALKERQYFNQSTEYSFLKAATLLLGNEALVGPETRRFTGPAALEEAALVSANI